MVSVISLVRLIEETFPAIKLADTCKWSMQAGNMLKVKSRRVYCRSIKTNAVV